MSSTAKGRLWRHVFGDSLCPGSGAIADRNARRHEARMALAWRQAAAVIRATYGKAMDEGWYVVHPLLTVDGTIQQVKSVGRFDAVFTGLTDEL